MKRVWTFLFSALVISLFYSSLLATSPIPAWERVIETPRFFKEKGFIFEVENLPKRLDEKKKIELVVVIPDSFVFDGLTNTFSHVLLLHDELGVDVQTWPHEGKKRVIIEISEQMARNSELYFYYKNAQRGVTDGTQYVVKVREIVENIKAVTTAQPKPTP